MDSHTAETKTYQGLALAAARLPGQQHAAAGGCALRKRWQSLDEGIGVERLLLPFQLLIIECHHLQIWLVHAVAVLSAHQVHIPDVSWGASYRCMPGTMSAVMLHAGAVPCRPGSRECAHEQCTGDYIGRSCACDTAPSLPGRSTSQAATVSARQLAAAGHAASSQVAHTWRPGRTRPGRSGWLWCQHLWMARPEHPRCRGWTCQGSRFCPAPHPPPAPGWKLPLWAKEIAGCGCALLHQSLAPDSQCHADHMSPGQSRGSWLRRLGAAQASAAACVLACCLAAE